jgi:hypothetical protein
MRLPAWIAVTDAAVWAGWLPQSAMNRHTKPQRVMGVEPTLIAFQQAR